MNVNELAGTIHPHYPQHVVSLPHTGQQAAASVSSPEDTKTREFSDILANYLEDDDNKDEEILSAIKDLAKSVEDLKTKNYNEPDSDLMSILTDQEKAMEYLSHQSGRNLLVEMAQNSIAGIISGSL